jgi:hypothetical protein
VNPLLFVFTSHAEWQPTGPAYKLGCESVQADLKHIDLNQTDV